MQRDFTSGHVYCFGSLGEASVKHSKQLRPVGSLGDVEQAGGGGPHSELRKFRDPSAHLQVAGLLLRTWSSRILYSLLARLPGMSDLMFRLR